MTEAMKLSVVIPLVSGLQSINECLEAMGKQRGAVKAEIIVVDRCRDLSSEHIRQCFPNVKLIQADAEKGIPELRSIGIAAATGEIIAITEDHCIVPETWFERILDGHRLGYRVVGGAVENGSIKRVRDWAAFLCEYSYFFPPLAGGETTGITGNNTSYTRDVLDSVDESVRRDCWEFFLHEELKNMGIKFLSAPANVVIHKKEFDFCYFLSQRFNYSRSFAAMRSRRTSFLMRTYYLVLTPALPLLLLWRIAGQIAQKKRYYREFLFSLPLLSLYGLSYAAGELMGYLFGEGRSLAKVE
jgi:GT2 family glycosyltransferase